MKRKLNVIVACESSATVRDAFRKLGHNAWSCDLLPCDHGNQRYHIQDDVLALLEGKTVAVSNGRGSLRHAGFDPSEWDLMIGHPPCTYLCNSGVRWLSKATKNSTAPTLGARWKLMVEAADFFVQLYCTNIPHIAIENPIMHGYARRTLLDLEKLQIVHKFAAPSLTTTDGRPTQIVQPWWFRHPCTKATGLYLRGLPNLRPTNIVDPIQGSVMHKLPPGPDRWKLRSKTFQGIADAMAAQWSAHILGL